MILPDEERAVPETRLFVEADPNELDLARAERFQELDLAVIKHRYLHFPTHLVVRGVDVLLPPWLPPGSNLASVFYTLLDFPGALDWAAYERSQAWELAEGGWEIRFAIGEEQVNVSTDLHPEPVSCGLVELAAAGLRFADEMRELLLREFPELAGHEGLAPWLSGAVPFPRLEDENLWDDRWTGPARLLDDAP
jgi:hypothetical protein